MSRNYVYNQIVEALKSVQPTEVKVHKEYSDLLQILIISESFKDMGVLRRIELCLDLLYKNAPDVSEDYLYTVEPVTQEEFATRSCPWPE